MSKILNLILLISITIIIFFLNIKYSNINLDKLLYTLIGITSVYFFGKIILEELLIKKIKDKKSRYTIKKTVNIISYVLGIIVITNIWVEDPRNLLIAYGIVGAGIAFSLQDLIKNFVGGMNIILASPFKIGDRIEFNSVTGDVMDIGILTTTMLELKNWVGGDQATGRIVVVPNGLILSQNILNFTQDHNFIWDEISISITLKSNFKKVTQELTTLFLRETKEASSQAEEDISKLEEKYYLERRSTIPSIYVTLLDNSIMVQIRYISFVRERRNKKDELYRSMIDLFNSMKDVEISAEGCMDNINK